jgi:transcriptional regulator with XRE-family HTH domain
MKTRILEFLRLENKSAAQLAEEIGVQPSGISHIISGRNNPSLDFVMKMLTKFPSLSSDWLLFGKGNMYREPQLTGLFENISLDKPNDFEIIDENRKQESFGNKSGESLKKSDIPSELKSNAGNNRTIRIVCFSADNTFKEYFPEG